MRSFTEKEKMGHRDCYDLKSGIKDNQRNKLKDSVQTSKRNCIAKVVNFYHLDRDLDIRSMAEMIVNIKQ